MRRFTKSRPLKCRGKVRYVSRSQVRVSLFIRREGEVVVQLPKNNFPKAACHKGNCFDYKGWFEGNKEIFCIKYTKPKKVTQAQIEAMRKEVAKSLAGIDWNNL